MCSGNNDCKDDLFCSSDNRNYRLKKRAVKCHKKKRANDILSYCNPSFEHGIKNAEPSCIDGSCKIDGWSDKYKCLK